MNCKASKKIKYPCGVCQGSARSGALRCNGLCNSWYHFKCLNITYAEIKKFSEDEITLWKCFHCTAVTDTGESDSTSNKIQLYTELISTQIEIENDNDLETSLHLAAELGSALLEENSQLKQKLHDEKLRKSKYELELDDKLEEAKYKIENLILGSNENEIDRRKQIKALENKLKISENLNNDLTQQLQKISNENCKECIMYREKVKKMAETIENLVLENINLKQDVATYLKPKENLQTESDSRSCLSLYPTVLINTGSQTTDWSLKDFDECLSPTNNQQSLISVINCLEADNHNLICEINALTIKNDKLQSEINFLTLDSGVKDQKSNTVEYVVSPSIPLNNRFAGLSDPKLPKDTLVLENTLSCPIQQRDVVQKPKPRQTSYCMSTQMCNSSSTGSSRNVRRRITVLSDSHGKNLYHCISELEKDFNVMVLCKPGATLNQVVEDGKALIGDHTSDDYVIVLAGTNDVCSKKGKHFLNQGIDHLLSLNLPTNIVICEVPYRYDTSQLNNWIYFANLELQKTVQFYQGNGSLNLFKLNDILIRKHFTSHGLHLNKHGKRHMGKLLVDFVRLKMKTNSLDFVRRTPTEANKLLYNTDMETVEQQQFQLPLDDLFKSFLLYKSLGGEPRPPVRCLQIQSPLQK